MALDRRRLLSVLAHEYGHLRGNHGRLSAWIYRTRLSWLKLDASLQRDEGVMALASQAFFRWYFPRFAATHLRAGPAGRVRGRPHLGLAAGQQGGGRRADRDRRSRAQWYAEHFWPTHWARAAHEPLAGRPVRRACASAWLRRPAPAFARQALRNALSRVSDVDDTHPVLRDRLEALRRRSRTCRPGRASPRCDLLADRGPLDRPFRREWCRDHANDWKQHHAYLRAHPRARRRRWPPARRRNNADEMVEWADLERRLDPQRRRARAATSARWQLTPEPCRARCAGWSQLLPAHDRAARLAVLERLHAADARQPLVGRAARGRPAGEPRRGPHERARAQALARAAARRRKRPSSVPGKRSSTRRTSARSRATT